MNLALATAALRDSADQVNTAHQVNIAVLDDDENMLAVVSRCVRMQGFACHAFSRVDKFYQALKTSRFDLIVLDWMMPQASGLDVVQKLRGDLGVSCPIMMISSRRLEHDVAFALYQGIDDYAIKPLRPAEFVARLILLLRRFSVVEEKVAVNYGPYVLKESSWSVTLHGKQLDISPKEFELAIFFFKHMNLRLARQQILTAVFGRSHEQVTRTLDTHVYRLRQRLQLDGRHGYKLMSIYGIGYRLANLDMAEDGPLTTIGNDGQEIGDDAR